MIQSTTTTIASTYYSSTTTIKETNKTRQTEKSKEDAKAKENGKAKKAEKLKDTGKAKETKEYGKTVGEPKLSDTAKKYYEKLKKQYGNYDFILVSEDEKENAKANASKYAGVGRTVVLIDEAKIEKMATDPEFRKKYENILSGAQSQLDQLKSSIEAAGLGGNVKGYGLQMKDDGTVSLFAVLKKSSSDQKARIEKHAAEKKAEKKQAEKKAEKKAFEEKLKNKKLEKAEREEKWNPDEVEIISADTAEELMSKITE
ncbi:MAG: DUF6033 family protein, partial [Lachnospiraceae bacterium]|nr:DUF6033 family protein [Lachnospiraceae bacterium]